MNRAWLIVRSGCLLLSIILPFCSVKAQAKSDENVVLQLREILEDNIFDVKITDNPNIALDRRLEIKCVKGCPEGTIYREDMTEVPLGAFLLGDASKQLITVWVGATAYWVRIYDLDSNGITKIFDQATKSAPQFMTADDWFPIVILDNPDMNEGPTTMKVRGAIWKWDGHEYKVAP